MRLRSALRACLIITAFILPSLSSCSDSRPQLEAEVQIANNSVYVWNRCDVEWTGGIVFLDIKSDDIQKTFGTVQPGGFAQLPLREFRKGTGSNATPADVTSPSSVLVEVDGYAPRRFELNDTQRR